MESNCYDVSAFLRKIGYDVVVEDKLKVAMLVQNEADLDTVGIKRSNLVVFDGKQVQMLLALWLLYLEKVGFSEEIYVTVGDVIDKCKVYGIEPAPTEFRGGRGVEGRDRDLPGNPQIQHPGGAGVVRYR